MPRSRAFDFLQSHTFWALDISAPIVGAVFTPLFGFSAISAPTMTAEVETFKEGTYLFPRHVIKGGTVGPVTFERGASMFDSDFWDWISYAIYGKSSGITGPLRELSGVRRNLLIIHHASYNVAGAIATAAGAQTSGNVATVGPYEFATRLPARAWVLYNCIPTNYTSGSGFDAKSGEVSIMSLEVTPESIDEYVLI